MKEGNYTLSSVRSRRTHCWEATVLQHLTHCTRTVTHMLIVDLLTGAVFPLCVCVCACVFRWAAEELTVNERPSPCPRGSMGCRRNGRRRGTKGSWWTSCCLPGSSSNSLCLDTTPSRASKKYGHLKSQFSHQSLFLETSKTLIESFPLLIDDIRCYCIMSVAALQLWRAQLQTLLLFTIFAQYAFKQIGRLNISSRH